MNTYFLRKYSSNIAFQSFCFALGNRVPVDGKTFIKEYVVVEETSRIVVFSLTSIGICLGLFFFVINIRFRNKRYMSNVVSVQFISAD